MVDQIRFAVAMRMGRAALGMNQKEFASLLGVSKSTVARGETLEMTMRADTLMRMLRVLHERGVDIDLVGTEEGMHLKVHPQALESALDRLQDESQRRSDRTKVRLPLTPESDNAWYGESVIEGSELMSRLSRGGTKKGESGETSD